MSATPLVSVVVPTHDRSTLVERAVRSALAQTVDDIEVLVVDDGSTDPTPATLAALAEADGRVRILRHDVARGAPAARNTGIEHAAGSHLALLDDDDEWLPTKLERQLELMADDPTLALVSCHHALVGDDGAALAYRGPTACTRAELLWCDFAGGSSLGLVRRDAFPGRELPRFDPDLPTCQDWDYWVRCAEHGGVAVVPEVLCRYAAGAAEDRLTNDRTKRVDGHRRFLAKHRSAMSDHCRAYLGARILLMSAASQLAEIALGPRLLATLPPRVSWILGREIVAARVGERRGDPGAGMRSLHAAIEGAA